MHTGNTESQRIVVAKWIGYLSLIDLLIFPYFQLIIIPYSLPLIMFGFILLDFKIAKDYYLKLYAIISGAVLISLTISLFLPPYSDYAVVNIKSAFQLLTSFFYFFYFRQLCKKTVLHINPILIVFIVWFILLGIMFLQSPVDANRLIAAIYGRLVNSEETVLYDFRFCYMFQDPNTAIYFFLVALAPLLMFAKSAFSLLVLLMAGGFMVLLCQSTGGLASYSAMVFALLLGKKLLPSFSLKKTLAFSLIFISLVGAGFHFLEQMKDNVVVDFAVKRLSVENDRYEGGGGRFKHWSALYNNLTPLPLGRGYTLYLNGYIEPPHSDFFGLLYRYGFLTLIPCMLFFFNKYRKFSPLLIPAAVTFAVNTLLDEQKLLALFLSLLAIVVTVKPSQNAGYQSTPDSPS